MREQRLVGVVEPCRKGVEVNRKMADTSRRGRCRYKQRESGYYCSCSEGDLLDHIYRVEDRNPGIAGSWRKPGGLFTACHYPDVGL